MKSLNRVQLLGRLGRDAETAFTQGGKSVTKFSLATDWSYKKGDEWVNNTDWSNIILWNKSDKIQLLKGSEVYVEGRLSTSSYEKDGNKVWKTEVIASDIKVFGDSNGQSRTTSSGSSNGITDDDVPF